MQAHHKLSDADFLAAMENGQLEPELFSHEAHLRWGWLLLNSYDLDTAIKLARNQLKQYVRFLGMDSKYNETVTTAAMLALHHFRTRHPTQSFFEFIRKAPRLKTSFKELMEAHYSRDIFSAPDAKHNFLEPDLLPFN